MGKKAKRDYRAEYARRVARATELGYSKSVGRGHPPRGVVGKKLARRYKVKPGTLIRNLPIPATGRETDAATIDREREALIAQGVSIKDIAAIDFHDETSFIKKLLELGYTPQEAYQLRFSP